MTVHMTINTLAALAVLLHVAAAVILIRQYLRTRDVGLVWLGVAVFVWPLVSRLLEAGERVSIDRVGHKQSVIYPFTLLESGQVTGGGLVMFLFMCRELIGAGLLLVAVLYVSRSKNHTVRPGVI